VPPRETTGSRLPELSAVAAGSPEKLAPEFVAGGFALTQRTATYVRWTRADELDLSLLVPTPDETGDDMVYEFAGLLTHPLPATGNLTMRITTPTVQLALWWRQHLANKTSLIESPEIEDIIEVITTRDSIGAELESLPQELQTAVRAAASELSVQPSLSWVVARAIPEARATPGMSQRVIERLRKLTTAA
jgi:hypothetical protein